MISIKELNKHSKKVVLTKNEVKKIRIELEERTKEPFDYFDRCKKEGYSFSSRNINK